MPWQKLPASQHRALLKKSLATRRSRILELAAEVGPVIEAYRAQGYGYRRIAALLNLSDHSPLRGSTWHPTTVAVHPWDVEQHPSAVEGDAETGGAVSV